MSAPPEAGPSRAGRTAKVVGVVLLVIGVALGALGITQTVRRLSTAVTDTFSGPVFTTPGDQQLHLGQAGTYLIMQDTSYRNGPGTNFAVAAVGPGDAAIIGPDGRELPLTATNGHNSVTRGPVTYFDILKFSAPVTGDYRLSVFEPSGVALIVVPSLGESVRRAASWISIGFLGGLCILLGGVLLIVGFTRANQSKHPQGPGPQAAAGYGGAGWVPAQAPGYPPPGWYPDPGRPGATQWWDGTRWRQ